MTIKAVGSTVSIGYADSLLDCIVEVWKRVYEFVCALFSYLFGSNKPEPAFLPPPITALISDYLLMPKQYADFLYVTQEQIGYRLYKFKIDLRIDQLRKDFISIMGVADCFNAPHLLVKIQNLCFEYYYIPKDQVVPHSSEFADLSCVLVCVDNLEEYTRSKLAKFMEISEEELPQAIRDWQTIKKIPAITDAFARHAKGEKFPTIMVPFTLKEAYALRKIQILPVRKI